ncbi:LPP20 family lipoprotein [Helicobacter sp. MIT 01-3238]|uniref:LPP20 family lipoprotein n=1 Tax=Helicobacter sp. MIT 01-3238 TaxID=398627 RepID=UPI000E1ED7DB|nr:LPP20 family lipoprotein [Helicobacter sp. MIT 01-3238]RDU52246.1 hypothetical protein CQA40_07860 [Helicobacter sp. MIT 01-3238]
MKQMLKELGLRVGTAFFAAGLVFASQSFAATDDDEDYDDEEEYDEEEDDEADDESPSTTSVPASSPRGSGVARSGLPADFPKENEIIEIEVVGIGVAPADCCTPAQAVAMAKRSAIVDGYRQLGEQMYGIKISSTDTVHNMVLKNSRVKTRVNAVIRGAQVRDSACKEGICQVNMELKLDSRVWSRIFGF